MKTYMAKKEDIKRKWYLVDAEGQVLGRLAVRIAGILIGKHRPEYSPNVETGDEVVVINASKVRLTGNKALEKTYKRYSSYPGGLKLEPYEHMMKRRPDFVVRAAVKGMLPKTKLQKKLMGRLRVYAGSEDEHAAQKPEAVSI